MRYAYYGNEAQKQNTFLNCYSVNGLVLLFTDNPGAGSDADVKHATLSLMAKNLQKSIYIYCGFPIWFCKLF